MFNDYYKSFLYYDLCPNLDNLQISSTNFIFNWKENLINEEYFSYKTNKFVTCYHCNKQNIKKIYIANRKFDDFLLNELNYYKCFNYYKDILSWMTVMDGYAEIEYCEDCKSILNVNNKPFFIEYNITSIDYERLLIKEQYAGLERNNLKSIKQCPYCNNTTFRKQSLSKSRVEYFCDKCNHYIYSFRFNIVADVQSKYFIDINKLGTLALNNNL